MSKENDQECDKENDQTKALYNGINIHVKTNVLVRKIKETQEEKVYYQIRDRSAKTLSIIDPITKHPRNLLTSTEAIKTYHDYYGFSMNASTIQIRQSDKEKYAQYKLQRYEDGVIELKNNLI